MLRDANLLQVCILGLAVLFILAAGVMASAEPLLTLIVEPDGEGMTTKHYLIALNLLAAAVLALVAFVTKRIFVRQDNHDKRFEKVVESVSDLSEQLARVEERVNFMCAPDIGKPQRKR